jgi:hypothetical protein
MGKEKPTASANGQPVKSIPFNERPGELPYNASEVVAIADSRFLFCDNNISDNLFEIEFTPEGELAGPLVRHAINGIRPEAIDDLECMALTEVDGERIIFFCSSFSLKKNKKKLKAKKRNRRGKLTEARDSLIRGRFGKEERPEGEVIPCFRHWLIENAPVLGKSPSLLPDDGGLNVEGLAWDPARSALVFGLRTPVKEGRPLLLRVRVKDPRGIWNLHNLEMLPPVTLAIDDADGARGVRTIEYDSVRGAFLVVVGNALSHQKVPFSLYSWDGNEEGIVNRFKRLSFHKKMKPEGVTHGTIGGRGVMFFVDDAGGYQFLWDDDPRLQ